MWYTCVGCGIYTQKSKDESFRAVCPRCQATGNLFNWKRNAATITYVKPTATLELNEADREFLRSCNIQC